MKRTWSEINVDGNKKEVNSLYPKNNENLNLKSYENEKDEQLLKIESLNNNRNNNNNSQLKQSFQNILKKVYNLKSNDNNKDAAPSIWNVEKAISNLNTIPLDLSLGKSIRFASKESFLWASELNSLAKSLGVQLFASRGNLLLTDVISNGASYAEDPTFASSNEDIMKSVPSLDICSNLYRSMLYYQFPASKLPSSIEKKLQTLVFTNNNDDDGSNLFSKQFVSLENEFAIHGYKVFKNILQDDALFLNDRMQQWRDSLSSVYMLFSNGICPYFYIIHEERLAILFIYGGVKNTSATFKAIVSTSAPDKMKQSLEQNWIKFQYKIEPGTFVFAGKKQVQSLFDYILMECVKHVSMDFPTIIAPVCFLNSSLKEIQIILNERFSKMNSNVEKQLYNLEFSGYILPHTKIALCRIISQACKIGDISKTNDNNNDLLLYSASFQVHRLTIPFNNVNIGEEHQNNNEYILSLPQLLNAHPSSLLITKDKYIDSTIKFPSAQTSFSLAENNKEMEKELFTSLKARRNVIYHIPEMNGSIFIRKISVFSNSENTEARYTITLMKN
jgi:hypothetical protein